MTLVHDPPPVIIDASVAVDVLTNEADAAYEAWEGWHAEARLRLAPGEFWYEVANALLRSQRLPASLVDALLGTMEEAGIEIADRGLDGVRAATALAARHGLTVYDAAYLWLAIDVDGELATRDRALIRAAEAEDVPLALL